MGGGKGGVRSAGPDTSNGPFDSAAREILAVEYEVPGPLPVHAKMKAGGVTFAFTFEISPGARFGEVGAEHPALALECYREGARCIEMALRCFGAEGRMSGPRRGYPGGGVRRNGWGTCARGACARGACARGTCARGTCAREACVREACAWGVSRRRGFRSGVSGGGIRRLGGCLEIG